MPLCALKGSLAGCFIDTSGFIIVDIKSNSADVGGPIVRGNTVTVLTAGAVPLAASFLERFGAAVGRVPVAGSIAHLG